MSRKPASAVPRGLDQEDTEELPEQLQSIYTQLIGAINDAIERLCKQGAKPVHLSDEFLESIIQEMLHRHFSRQELQKRVDGEILHQILLNAECKSIS